MERLATIPVGITKRNSAYRARVSIGGVNKSKEFSFKVYSQELALQYACEWLDKTRKSLATSSLGITSKYKLREAPILTVDRLKEVLAYNPDTGIFIWQEAIAVCIEVGTVAGCYDADGYILIRVFNKMYKAHRLAFAFMTDTFLDAELDVDHINRNPSDNRWINLRAATRSQNQQNKVCGDSTLNIKGLCYTGDGRYIKATITTSGIITSKQFALDDILGASNWIDNQRDLQHGEYANRG